MSLPEVTLHIDGLLKRNIWGDFSLKEFNYFHSEFSQVLECLTSPTPPGLPDRPTAVRCGTDFIELAWKEPETHGCKFNGCFYFVNPLIPNFQGYQKGTLESKGLIIR